MKYIYISYCSQLSCPLAGHNPLCRHRQDLRGDAPVPGTAEHTGDLMDNQSLSALPKLTKAGIKRA